MLIKKNQATPTKSSRGGPAAKNPARYVLKRGHPHTSLVSCWTTLFSLLSAVSTSLSVAVFSCSSADASPNLASSFWNLFWGRVATENVGLG